MSSSGSSHRDRRHGGGGGGNGSSSNLVTPEKKRYHSISHPSHSLPFKTPPRSGSELQKQQHKPSMVTKASHSMTRSSPITTTTATATIQNTTNSNKKSNKNNNQNTTSLTPSTTLVTLPSPPRHVIIASPSRRRRPISSEIVSSPADATTVTTNNNNNTTSAVAVAPNSPCAIALDYSAQASECLEQQELEVALQWYQRALLVYQTTLLHMEEQNDRNDDDDDDGTVIAELSIVDTCNAAATLHNMGAVYTALEQADAALQCYSDAESLYRECRERLLILEQDNHDHDDDNDNVHQQYRYDNIVKTNNNKTYATNDTNKQEEETVCLTALIAETLHHRASIYESSIWDSVAALECHEACVELLTTEEIIDDDGNDDDGTTPKQQQQRVVCIDDVYFELYCPTQDKIQWLTTSYKALSKLYKNSDTPTDGLVALQSWQHLLTVHLNHQQQQQQQRQATKGTTATRAATTTTVTAEWRASLTECYQQLAEYYFDQNQVVQGVDALQKAMELQIQRRQEKSSSYVRDSTTTITTNTSSTDASSHASSSKSSSLQSVAAMSHALIQQMNTMALQQEDQGDYNAALVCYEKVLLCISKYLGDNHMEVAEALVNIGRVMELLGNSAGGLDLYQAAHTIYQAAQKDVGDEAIIAKNHKNKSSIVPTSPVSMMDAENDDNDKTDEDDQALSNRAATASVVRIANVLMSQKRWQEAVDFLRELPQAKEWLSWLGDDETSSSSSFGHDSLPASPSRKSPPSVDQAIVFRELGRAYMGMGSLGKAKQCLLESARRLEGTDHEEDVFELLMHVEFCQKQEQKASLASRGKNRCEQRSQSKSRTRTHGQSNRSGHSRSNSNGNSSLTRITKDAVAAVLSPTSLALSESRSSPPKMTRYDMIQVDSPKSPAIKTSSLPLKPPPASPQWIEDNQSADTRSLGSLATQSSVSSQRQTPVKPTSRNAPLGGDATLSPNDSFQVARAKDIIMKRFGSSPTTLLQEDGSKSESDVVSSVLLGLDIDIDLPPNSPSPRRPEKSQGAARSTQHHFDGASLSQASSVDRPFDEGSRRSSTSSPVEGRSGGGYPMLPVYRTQLDSSNESDLTPSLGRSSSSSLTNASATYKKAKQLPSLLQQTYDEHDTDQAALLPPPPIQDQTQMLPRLSCRLSPTSASTSSSTSPFPVQCLSSASPEGQELKDGVNTNGLLLKDNRMPSGENDDASSDPFEGYDEFEEDALSEGNKSPSYSGDSESGGYTRFAEEDILTSDEEDSVESYGKGAFYPLGPGMHHVAQQHHELVARKDFVTTSNPHQQDKLCEDVRQPGQAYEGQPVSSSSGTRDSPLSGDAPPVSSNPFRDKHISPSLRVETNERLSSEKDSPTNLSTPTKKKRHTPSPSPSHRIVRALSNSIRRRRRMNKNGRGFDTLPSNDSQEKCAEAKEADEVSPTEQAPPQEADDEFDEDLINAPNRPIQFLSMPSPSFDQDAVSQITFLQDDYKVGSSKSTSQWWGQLGLTGGRLDGWFPANTYLNQAVEAAEGFLSAKAIHQQVKSQPLDFDSDDDEEDDVNVQKNVSLPAAAAVLAATTTTADDLVGTPCGNIHLFQDDNSPISPAILVPPEIPKDAALLNKSAFPSEVLTATPSPEKKKNQAVEAKTTLANEVERHEQLVEQLESEGADDDATNRKLATTMFRLSILYIQSDKLEEAMDATNEALRMQKMLGDSADATRSLHLLADIFVRKGEYESALSCYAEVQDMELALYGYIHEDTANTLNRIGSVLARQSKFSLAMGEHHEALRILKEYHGEELRHPMVSQTLIHIGAVYYRERNSLVTARNGSDNYSTFIEAGMLEVIGRAHEDRGSYKMAISFFQEKLQFLNQKSKDPQTGEGRANLEDVATTLNSIGMLSCRAGIYMEAIAYYDRALEVQKQIGCDKLHVATARVLTATVQFHLGYYRKALRLLQDALEELQLETGTDHETVAATWFQIGVVQVAMCEYDDGMDALEEALRIQTKLLGKVHPATLRTRREIGNMYAIYESELDAAFLQFNDILTTQRRIHGYKHPNVAETLHSLGCAFARKGDYSNAIKTLEECYYMRMDYLGADHPLQATTLHEIAVIHKKRQRYRKAIHICNAVLQIRKETLSERHLDVAVTMATRADCLVAIGKFKEAQDSLMDALPMIESSVGPRHPAMADMYIHIAGMHLRKCHFDEAKEWIEKALSIYHSSNFDVDHPSLKEAVALMERVDRDEMLCV